MPVPKVIREEAGDEPDEPAKERQHKRHLLLLLLSLLLLLLLLLWMDGCVWQVLVLAKLCHHGSKPSVCCVVNVLERGSNQIEFANEQQCCECANNQKGLWEVCPYI